jgi:23S rRNA (cytidine1920-2'-O)/16S rRNA (cytidine1409-2'-O)-methyltransferase
MRADELLVAAGLAESRNLAQRLILAGQVRTASGEMVDKPGREYARDADFSVLRPPPYVGRGGEKLAGFFQAFPWDLAGVHGLDVGASTGGFTDYLLQRGAASVTCVDVGHGQLHPRLLRDPRVTNREGVNARRLAAASLPRAAYGVIAVDLSFISLRAVLPELWPLLEGKGLLVALIKPQFEASRREASRGRGVIGDPAIHRRVREELAAFAVAALPASRIVAEVPSPLTGADGNREFFIGIARRTDGAADPADVGQFGDLAQALQGHLLAQGPLLGRGAAGDADD